MYRLQHYLEGRWVDTPEAGEVYYHAVTGEPIASCSSENVDYTSIFDYGRKVGGPALRKMTFHERGRMLKALALHLLEKKELFYDLSVATGATRADSWIDIEGGIGNLFAYASLRRKFQDLPYYVEGEAINLSRENTFMGHHILVPKEGIALHINAFNFPVWGMLEKVAVNWLAGVPAIVKPSPITAFLAESVAKEMIASGILPPGALQLVCGEGLGILEPLTYQDVVTFTGSAETGRKLKSLSVIVNNSVPFTMEADSLNCAILAPDALPGTVEFDLFIKEARKEMTVKCGQKCTAIRRLIVPLDLLEDVQIALGKALSQTRIGHPLSEGVRMGALVSKSQQTEVMARLQLLLEESEIVYGNPDEFEVVDADKHKGAFLPPLLLRNDHPLQLRKVHEIEAFGPIATLMPYNSMEEAVEISRLGKGSLCSTIVTKDPVYAREWIMGSAVSHGRILILNEACAKESTGHGSPLPLLVHGGPGRAGGGEEMGGVRGVLHYMQRTAVQGSPTMLTQVTGLYQPGAERPEAPVHVFRKYFEDLAIGETVYTHKRTISEADIVQFANVSWDHFYAHTDETSLDGTLFEKRVAHGYFILSAAAGLFVDPAKGPVLLNYGIEECRFIKPVYAGTTIGVKLTVKEKTDQAQREESDIPRGIVKYYVDIYDQTGESVAVATILTMVKKRSASL